MDNINLLLISVLSASIVPLFVWLMSLINQKKVAEWLSSIIVKILNGNIEQSDDIEESIGDLFIQIGENIKNVHETKTSKKIMSDFKSFLRENGFSIITSKDSITVFKIGYEQRFNVNDKMDDTLQEIQKFDSNQHKDKFENWYKETYNKYRQQNQSIKPFNVIEK